MTDNQKKTPLIILTGPTAVGKTALSIRLAHALGGSVISADSMQVYRGMNIGTAKIRPEEMEGIPHYLIDILDPSEEFNVMLFQQYAKQAIREILLQGRVPILTGGTGFYIQAVLYDIDFTQEESDPSLRKQLETLAAEQGGHVLHERLARIDPVSAEMIHENNLKRMIRAIEFYEKTGIPISQHNFEQRKRCSPYDFRYFVLTDDRGAIYRRIDHRVDRMIELGLEDEVRALMKAGIPETCTAMQGIGYKEFIPWLRGRIDREEAVRILKRDTRHFAKRQLTWFRREKDVVWIDRREYDDNEEQILAAMLARCEDLTDW